MKTILLALLINTVSLTVVISLSSCATSGQATYGPRPSSADRSTWASYKESSPFWPYKMWAFSLPNDDNASLGCVDNRNFAVLSRLVSDSERVGRSASNPDIQRHIQETTAFWREIIAAQPALREQALRINDRVEGAARDGFESGYNNSSGGVVNRGHIGGMAGLFGALANLGPMMSLYRPHVARYAPEALRLARQEQQLDRKFGYQHPSSEALQKNIEYLEVTVSRGRN